MSKNYYGRKLTAQEIAKVEVRIREVRDDLGFTVGDPITFNRLKEALTWVKSNFKYQSDGYVFDRSDFWSTIVFDLMMLEGMTEDDCDGAGYGIIEFLIRVFGMDLARVFRVGCQTETNEGHFVVWARADDGVYYQLENRIGNTPRTVKAMHDKGYIYWYYSSMERKYISKNKWFNAMAKMKQIVYDTPNNTPIEAEEPHMTIGEIVRATPDSRTLQYGAGYMGGGLAVAAGLANQHDWKVVALFGAYALIGGLGFYYFRSITTRPLDRRKNV